LKAESKNGMIPISGQRRSLCAAAGNTEWRGKFTTCKKTKETVEGLKNGRARLETFALPETSRKEAQRENMVREGQGYGRDWHMEKETGSPQLGAVKRFPATPNWEGGKRNGSSTIAMGRKSGKKG